MSEGHPIVAFFEPLTAWYGDRAGLREWRRELLTRAHVFTAPS